MSNARAVNHKINRLHERGLTTILDDETSTFKDMLSRNNDSTIHVKNIRKLMIEFCKHLYGLSAPIMKEAFSKRVFKYNLQSCKVTLLPNPETKKYGTDTVGYKAAQTWRMLPSRYNFFFHFNIYLNPEWKTGIVVTVPAIFVDGVASEHWHYGQLPKGVLIN